MIDAYSAAEKGRLSVVDQWNGIARYFISEVAWVTDLEQVQALGPRIDAAARNARILEAWQAELEGVEPAAVHVTPVFDAGSFSD